MLRSGSKQAGFTLIEIAIVIAVIGVMVALGIPQFNSWSSTQRLRASARSLVDTLSYARSEAMRSGNNHIVFFRVDGVSTQDAAGTNISDVNGNDVPALVIDDGRPGTGNCLIDANERKMNLNYTDGVSWGSSFAAVKAPQDAVAGPGLANGITFADPEVPASPRVWVMFRPDGIPVGFTGAAADCDTIGDTGTGGGAIYVTNGDRDYAAVMSPLGGVRLHVWDEENTQWSN